MAETAALKIARLNRSIARTGETVTLQHTDTDDFGAVSVTGELTLPAHIRASDPQDLLGGADIVEMRVILSSTQLLASSPPFGIPRRDDRILIHDSPANIVTIAPIWYGGQLVRVNLLCRG